MKINELQNRLHKATANTSLPHTVAVHLRWWKWLERKMKTDHIHLTDTRLTRSVRWHQEILDLISSN